MSFKILVMTIDTIIKSCPTPFFVDSKLTDITLIDKNFIIKQ